MTLLDIITRLKVEAPTALTLEEELYMQHIMRRRDSGEPLGKILLEEGITPEALAALQPEADVMERAMQELHNSMH